MLSGRVKIKYQRDEKKYLTTYLQIMKKRNCISEFSTQRSEFLLQNFRRSIAEQSRISMRRAFQEAADAPAPRFWVGESRAAIVIGMMMRGEDPTPGMSAEKGNMYREIYVRVMALRETEPEATIGDLVFRVVNSPAPKSYLAWGTAKNVIKAYKNGRKPTTR